jgi:splicing factor U2AF subunit
VGNLPLGVTEDQIHQEFRQAIERAYVPPPELTEDPILSVYINHERRFCFLEFKTVEMTTACLNLDGYTLNGQTLKIKRPNDYSEGLAPRIHPSALPNLDVSRLGMISGTVLDGPNKIFIGGLHYHLTDAQVLELLQAFGPVKAFHLVKQADQIDASGVGMSKGYCFVEYANPNTTATAIAGLNGMDIGGGKTLTARLAGERGTDLSSAILPATAPAGAEAPLLAGQPPPDRTIVHGYDIEALVDAALGKVPMPTAPLYLDGMGVPMTRIVPLALQVAAAASAALAQVNQFQSTQAPPPPVPPPTAAPPSRVLVLDNMVQDDDLATPEDHAALRQEVQEECNKFGTLLDVVIPTKDAASGVGKIFLRYETVEQAEKAKSELQGRDFGGAVVQVNTLSEDDFKAGRFQ